ncbi:MAG: hypothetical protein CMI16_12715 [Opitutaceae bacterium]|nr:hypothetical protein [Opitutaceae bacterium]
MQDRVLRFVPDVLDWRGRADKSDELKLSDIETPPIPDPYTATQTLCIWVKSEDPLSVAGLRWYVMVATNMGGLRGRFKHGMQQSKEHETFTERRAWWDRVEATGDAALRKKFDKIGVSVHKCMASVGIRLPGDTRTGDTLSFDCDAGSFTHVAYSTYDLKSNTKQIEVPPALWKIQFRARNVKITERAAPPPPPPPPLNQPGLSSGDSDVVEVGERTWEQRDAELRKNAIDLTDD